MVAYSKKRNSLKVAICVCLAILFIVTSQVVAFAAYNTVDYKPYPTLTSAEIMSGSSSDMEIHLKFSNNVGCIDEKMEGRYDMTGYNAANLTKFHLAATDGTSVDIRVTPHPSAAMHTDESKYFYIFANGVDTTKDYVLTVDEDLYANMGNSLGSSYEVKFNLSTGTISFSPTSKLPSQTSVQPLYFVSSSVANNSTDVELQPSITLKFAYNVSGIEVLEYNCAFISLQKGTETIPVQITAGENVTDLIVKPKSQLLPSTEYKIAVTKYLMARNGSTLSSPVNLYFTTKSTTSSGGSSSSNGSANSGGSSSSSGSTNSGSSSSHNGNTSGSGINVSKTMYFSDLGNSWAADFINSLADRGAVTGNPDGTFLPDNKITRAEIVAIMVRALNLSSNETVNFSDTSKHWAKGYISIAASCGIAKGVGEGIFSPGEMVTREQLATMIVRAGGLTSKSNEPAIFTDRNTASSWATSNIDIASQNNIISGYPDGSFKPQNNVTRAEACSMIVKFLNNKK